jgi:hypothetical protein
VTDWQNFLWWAAVVMAVAGGVVSTTAYVIGRRDRGGKNGDKKLKNKTHVLYLVSYIFMSISIFLIALRGLLG